MTLEDFSQIIDKIKKEKPVWFGLDSDLLVDDNQIKEMEDYFKLKLPVEYKQFLKTYGGGYFAFLVIFSGDLNSNWNVIRQNKKLNLLTRYKFLAISDNETGDYYGFKIINNQCEAKVSIFLHEEDKVVDTQYEDFYQYVIKLGLRI